MGITKRVAQQQGKRTIAGVALTAGVLLMGIGSGVADASTSAAPRQTEIDCTGNTYYTDWGRVVGADWVKVHRYPDLSSPAVGQLSYHSGVCGAATRPGFYLVEGYNGSTLVKGWVDWKYISYPN